MFRRLCRRKYNINLKQPPLEPPTIINNDAVSTDSNSLRYGFTNDDIHLLSVLLTGSKNVDGDGEFDFDYGRGEEYDQISLVLGVVMNRVQSDKFPNTVSEVIWQGSIFSNAKLVGITSRS